MSRERHLIARREDAHARLRFRRWQQEGGFRQIELSRQCLHGGGVERSAVLEHAQRIAAERPSVTSEDIQQAVIEFHVVDQSPSRPAALPPSMAARSSGLNPGRHDAD